MLDILKTFLALEKFSTLFNIEWNFVVIGSKKTFKYFESPKAIELLTLYSIQVLY